MALTALRARSEKKSAAGKNGVAPAIAPFAAVEQQELGLVVAVEQLAAAHGDAVAVDGGGDQVAAPATSRGPG